MNSLHSELTREIIGASYEVHRHLGHGFLEKVYVAALLRELASRGISTATEAPVAVRYKGGTIGQYYADFLVEGKVICEVKAVRQIIPEHEAQLLNYLKATGIEVGLLLNFGWTSVQLKRLAFSRR